METSQVKIGESYLLTFPEILEPTNRGRTVKALALLDYGAIAVRFDNGEIDTYWARWLKPLENLSAVNPSEKSYYHANPAVVIQKLIELELRIAKIKEYEDKKERNEEIAEGEDYVHVLELLEI